MHIKKSCGNCKEFWKCENNSTFKGLCEFKDLSTNTQFKGCKFWKGIKYKRSK